MDANHRERHQPDAGHGCRDHRGDRNGTADGRRRDVHPGHLDGGRAHPDGRSGTAVGRRSAERNSGPASSAHGARRFGRGLLCSRRFGNRCSSGSGRSSSFGGAALFFACSFLAERGTAGIFLGAARFVGATAGIILGLTGRGLTQHALAGFGLGRTETTGGTTR